MSDLPCLQVLKIIRDRNVLRLGSTQEVLHDGIRVVPERDLDGSIEAMNVPVVTGPLVCLVLSHQGKKLVCRPALGLEVVVVGGRGSSVHLLHC